MTGHGPGPGKLITATLWRRRVRGPDGKTSQAWEIDLEPHERRLAAVGNADRRRLVLALSKAIERALTHAEEGHVALLRGGRDTRPVAVIFVRWTAEPELGGRWVMSG